MTQEPLTAPMPEMTSEEWDRYFAEHLAGNHRRTYGSDITADDYLEQWQRNKDAKEAASR